MKLKKLKKSNDQDKALILEGHKKVLVQRPFTSEKDTRRTMKELADALRKSKKPKKPSRKALVRTLDKVFSEYIRSVYTACVCCGSRENLSCGHLFSREAKSTRWEELNCATQCFPCNALHEYNPNPFTNWFLNRYGQDAYDQLHWQFVTPKKFSNPDLQSLIEEYRGKLEGRP